MTPDDPPIGGAQACTCGDTKWVDDQNWQPEDYQRNDPRRPGRGRIGEPPRFGPGVGCRKPPRLAEVSETVRASWTQAKLTEDDVREIRAAVAAGASKLDLARQYGVSKTAIHSAVVRRTWTHVS